MSNPVLNRGAGPAPALPASGAENPENVFRIFRENIPKDFDEDSFEYSPRRNPPENSSENVSENVMDHFRNFDPAGGQSVSASAHRHPL